MNTQFKKGALELCVLALISEKDRYGYELAQDIMGSINIAEGTLYPLLRRLNKEGFLETYLAPSTEGAARKYYYITNHGKERMDQLVEEWKDFTSSVEHLLKNVGRE
ncbi:PadR family transcriptional regulator [Halobacillus sp. SY10]|uniref:PadR family transcriptional regulator, regulatory protein PadR n=2 Tax=Halobacillus TaxID=45667 RepID=A0A1H0LZV6_HALAD|nr:MULTISPECIES: PadR family transcriptional regulator [Halobacillus]RDY67671.1 PadR family transcriptional regulator [Halobacillus trueperi]SDO73665.1 PadR family transcriptional regulator, regulatory protein PadR [Halobacillus aidingensis]